MNIYEKLGDFLLNIIQLVVGGIIFAGIMSNDKFQGITLYVIAVSVISALFILAMILFKYAKNKKEE